MKKNSLSKSRHYPRRFLKLRELYADGGKQTVEIRCTEESQGNYWGHALTGPTPEKLLRFPKSLWEVQNDETK